MKVFNKALMLAASVALLATLQAKIIEVAEDGYMMPAPQEVRNIAEKAAALVGFDTGYEIVAPKKSSTTINPWTKFVAYAINPITKNPLMIVNTEWFSKIPENQQLFLLARSFMILSKQVSSLAITLVPYLFILLSLLLIVLAFFALQRTALRDKKLWIRILVACGIGLACELVFLNKLELATSTYFRTQYDKATQKLVVQKTQDKDAAIQALEFLDASLKNELGNGDLTFAPYENLFKSYAQDLKNTDV